MVERSGILNWVGHSITISSPALPLAWAPSLPACNERASSQRIFGFWCRRKPARRFGNLFGSTLRLAFLRNHDLFLRIHPQKHGSAFSWPRGRCHRSGSVWAVSGSGRMVLAFLESDSITDALQSRTGAFDVDALQALVCSMAPVLALVESIYTILRPMMPHFA